MKIVVINDLHPETSPGAASIAYGLAREAFSEYETEFWCTELVGVMVQESEPVKIRRIPRSRASRMEGNHLARLYNEILGFRELFWMGRQLNRFRPTHMWVHQVGNRFPKSVLFLAKILGVKLIVTVHDFGLILNRKLYPGDFSWDISEVEKNIQNLNSVDIRLHKQTIERFYVLKLRRFLVFFLYNLADEIVCLSNTQSIILQKFGLNVSVIVPNGVKSCECIGRTKLEDGRINVLFVGRPIGKGLELLIDAIAKTPQAHLHLAGGAILKQIVEKELRPEFFTFHGFLVEHQIAALIHQVDLVAVLSNCFDVYPTITLEALSHRTPVITNALTGNSQLVRSLADFLVIPCGETPDLIDLQVKLKLHKGSYPYILSQFDSWENYKEIFNRIS